MAFVVKDYGNGSLGDVDSVSSTINSYARVTAVTSSTITINTSTQITGAATFTVGAKILLHVSATTSSSYKTYLGCWMLANITATSSGVLTLDADPTTCIPSAQLANYYVQAIAVAQYKNLTLNSGTTITPPVYNATNYVGGIVALMCSDTLTFAGGHISLTDRGIPTANAALRPTTNNDPVNDQDNYAGWENSDTRIHFMLNAGDGAAFIIAKNMICSTSSRIGNTATRGYQFYRGATDSVTYSGTAPSDVTNVGGSTILVAAQTITNFTPYMFAKYRSSSSIAGQGICRCYIASETKLRNDEGLYAYDCISDKARLKRMFGIRNFGNGSFGDLSNVKTQLNNYAKVTAINGNKVTITGATTTGLAPLTVGAMVMIHWNHNQTANVAEAGRFYIANVLEEFNGVLTLDCTLPNISITDYMCQVVSIPQAKNFMLSTTNSSTPAMSDGRGGICAIAVSDTFTFWNGVIDVSTKGSGYGYYRAGLDIIGNAQDSNKLPIGAGHGSVFVLAQNILINDKSRIGKAAPGSNGVGAGLAKQWIYTNYSRLTSSHPYVIAATGGGNVPSGYYAGGYGGNGRDSSNGHTAEHYQGAHVMIVANKITTFNVNAISTGGGKAGDWGAGAGYGDGTWYSGSYNAGGNTPPTDKNGTALPAWGSGGSSGWAFIYCNEVVNQDTTGTVLAN